MTEPLTWPTTVKLAQQNPNNIRPRTTQIPT